MPPAPVQKEEPSFENELLKKLKKRQESIDTPPGAGEQLPTQSNLLTESQPAPPPTLQETTPTNQPPVSCTPTVNVCIIILQ